jgi:hypothetical protein
VTAKARKRRRVPGAPIGALNLTQFAVVVGTTRPTIYSWLRAGRIKAREVLVGFRRVKYFVPADAQEFLKKRWWRSGRGMRLARQLLKGRGQS